jgi:hypothetical protein
MRHAHASALLALTSALLAMMSLTLSSAIAQDNPPENGNLEIDDSTPEAAIRSFYGAIAKGDSKSALQLLTMPDELEEWAEIQARTSLVFRQLGEAAVKRFGDEGKSLQGPVPAEATVRKLDSIAPILKGDTAEWPLNPKAPLRMKRIDGHWRLDIYASFPSPAHIKQYNDVSGGTADYVGRIATDITEGKFESVAEVREEFKRQREALNARLANSPPATK